MSTATYHVGDSLTVLRTLPSASVDLVVTSPPYLALRSYLPKDHPDKGREMGSEATPGEFLDALLDVTEELRRVLAPHGTLAIELGDTYAGGGQGPDAHHQGSERPVAASHGTGWPLDRSLCLIPESYRFALVYGRNPFTGRETPRWRVRNVVRHFRPNPPVGALGDKFRPATSEWVVACVNRRYFDLDAVRTEHKTDPTRYSGNGYSKGAPEGIEGNEAMPGNPAGAPPLDWWADDDLEWRDHAGLIEPTFGYPGAHYATFSPKVIKRLIEPQCPARVCRVCGKPSERITSEPEYVQTRNGAQPAVLHQRQGRQVEMARQWATPGMGDNGVTRKVATLGWSDCGHNDWRRGIVLDPFAGSGTTLAVATGLGRDAIGIDLDHRNLELARERIGFFLEDAP